MCSSGRSAVIGAVLAAGVVLSSCESSGGPVGGDAGAGGSTVRVRVLTWNVHRLFDTRCDSSRCGAGEYEVVLGADALAARASTVAAAIAALEPDVAILQEIESEEALAAVHRVLGAGWRTAVLAEIGGAATLDVAVLARAPALEVRSHLGEVLVRPDGSRTRFSRDLPEVHLDLGATKVAVFGAHFRSKADDDPGRRLAEAETSGRIISDLARAEPGLPIIFGGDLNDTPGSPPIAALETAELFRVASSLPPGQDATYQLPRGTALALDHLFVPRAQASTVVPGTLHVVRDDRDRLRYGGSDHAALVADFALPAR